MSTDREKDIERFLRDVQHHEMQVLRDDGVYRHLRFKKPGTMCRHFDIVTWPGYLAYTGDMGAYVFTRVFDMLTFFRGDKPDELFRWIDRRYWAEKCDATDKHGGIKEFSEEKWRRAVLTYLVEWIREHRSETTKEQRKDLWEAVHDEVLGVYGDSDGMRQQAATYDFTHKVNADLHTFYFQDFFERDMEEYTHRFTWCCFALRWAIRQYDTHKAKAEQAVAA